MSPESAPLWSLVVPVKRLADAKTRMRAVAGTAREQVALAFAVDTVTAAVACRSVGVVVVVTDDAAARAALSDVGAVVVEDTPDRGLNPALVHGAEYARQLAPGRPCGALSADLPALRPGTLALALGEAAVHPVAFVADAAGTGTTLLTWQPDAAVRPSFGADSRTRHRAAGYHELTQTDLAPLRCDVDTEADLRRAVELGVGGHTADVLQALELCRR